MKKLLSAIGLAATLSLPISTQALQLDWDGVGGDSAITGISTFDWLPGSAYTIGGQSSGLSDGDTLTTYVQGTLGSFIDGDGNEISSDYGLGSAYEITFVAGFDEVVFGISNSLNPVTGEYQNSGSFAVLDSPANFFEIWIDTNPSNKANALEGTGYNDGVLLAAGTILSGGGGSTASTFVYSGDPNNPISTNPNDYDLLDQFGVDNWAGVKTNSGIGGTDVDLVANYINQDFITNWAGILNLTFNASQKTPFEETNPSRRFVDENGNVIVADTGTINGITGTGVILQVDGNSALSATPVPLPGTLVLLGSGLLGLIGFRKS